MKIIVDSLLSKLLQFYQQREIINHELKLRLYRNFIH